MFTLFSLLILAGGAIAQPNTSTTCAQQLHYFYEQQGLNASYPTLEPILFVQGNTSGHEPFVEATVAFQATARTYAQNISGSNSSDPVVIQFSFDLPWCATNLSITCAGQTLFGVGKTDACMIIDYDQGGDTQVAGRVYVYVNQSGACANAAPVVTLYNVSLIPANTDDGVWTYSTTGLFQPYIAISQEAALQFYENSTCFFSDGNVTDAATQHQFVCYEQRIGCATQRTGAIGTAPVVPIPQFLCIGNLSQNSTNTSIVWAITSYNLPGQISGTFKLAFCLASDFGCQNNFQQNAGAFQTYSLIAGTRRQFISPYNTFNQLLLLYYNGRISTFAPTYPFAPQDNILRNLPCYCGSSVTCENGQVLGDNVTVAMQIYLNNALPVSEPGPSEETVVGEATFAFDASKTYDPDHLPGPLTTILAVYSEPTTEEPTITIAYPTLAVQTLNSSLWVAGLYQLRLYACDTQACTYALKNITVVQDLIYVVIQPSPEVEFTPYCGESPEAEGQCPEPGSEPSPCIPLNGTGTFATDPNATLTFLWMQTQGYVTPDQIICDITCVQNTAVLINYTQLVACFVPPNIGLYCYNFTVSDGTNNVTADTCIFVIPNFVQPTGTPLNLTNYTRPPPINTTVPERPQLNFTNATNNPTTAPTEFAPTEETTTEVAPLFPTYPLTLTEGTLLLGIVLVACFVVILLLLFLVLEAPLDAWNWADQILYTADSY